MVFIFVSFQDEDEEDERKLHEILKFKNPFAQFQLRMSIKIFSVLFNTE